MMTEIEINNKLDEEGERILKSSEKTLQWSLEHMDPKPSNDYLNGVNAGFSCVSCNIHAAFMKRWMGRK